jgi:KUP system potassium uptake protein
VLSRLGDLTYFLSSVLPVRGGGMAMWRKQLFAALRRNAVSPAVYYRLPHDQVVSLDGAYKF